MAGGKFTVKQRAVMFERARGCCEVCGCRLREKGWNAHHRAGRGMGGTRREVTCADGLVVCGSGTTGCHGLIERERKWALDNGFLVSRWADAAAVPVLVRGAWARLTPQGTVTWLDDLNLGTRGWSA